MFYPILPITIEIIDKYLLVIKCYKTNQLSLLNWFSLIIIAIDPKIYVFIK